MKNQEFRKMLVEQEQLRKKIKIIQENYREPEPEKKVRAKKKPMVMTEGKYSKSEFENKIKTDKAILEVLIKNIEGNEAAEQLINETLVNIYSLARTFYEHSNQKPTSLIKWQESPAKFRIEATKVINEFFERNVYSKQPHVVYSTYQEEVIKTLMENVQEGVLKDENLNDAIEVAYKFFILEELIDKIIFPKNALRKTEYILIEEGLGESTKDNYRNLFKLYKKNRAKAANTIALFV